MNLHIDLPDHLAFIQQTIPNEDYQDHFLDTTTKEAVNIFENRIDDCSKTEWIPFYNLDLDPLRFAD